MLQDSAFEPLHHLHTPSIKPSSAVALNNSNILMPPKSWSWLVMVLQRNRSKGVIIGSYVKRSIIRNLFPPLESLRSHKLVTQGGSSIVAVWVERPGNRRMDGVSPSPRTGDEQDPCPSQVVRHRGQILPSPLVCMANRLGWCLLK